MNLVGKILEQMQTDDDDTDRQSDILLEIYTQADVSVKRVIDDVMVCLCGLTMKSLASMVSPKLEDEA